MVRNSYKPDRVKEKVNNMKLVIYNNQTEYTLGIDIINLHKLEKQLTTIFPEYRTVSNQEIISVTRNELVAKDTLLRIIYKEHNNGYVYHYIEINIALIKELGIKIEIEKIDITTIFSLIRLNNGDIKMNKWILHTKNITPWITLNKVNNNWG